MALKMKKQTFTREEVIKIMEDLRLYEYDWEKKKWHMGGHMAPAMIYETSDQLITRFGYDDVK